MASIELSPTDTRPVRWQVRGDHVAPCEFATPLDALLHARGLLDRLARDAPCDLHVCFDGELRTRLLHRGRREDGSSREGGY